MAETTPKIGLHPRFRASLRADDFDILDDAILAANLLGSGTITIFNDGQGNITISGSDSGGAGTLQEAYDGGPEIIVASNNEVVIRDNATPTVGNIFDVQDNSSSTILAVSSGVISAGQHFRPVGDIVQSIGTFDNRFNKVYGGGGARFISGVGNPSDIFTNPDLGTGHTFVHVVDDTGTNEIIRNPDFSQKPPDGNLLVGAMAAVASGGTCRFDFKDTGSLMGGYLHSGYSGYTATIESLGYYSQGGLVFGYVSAGGKDAAIKGGGAGSFVLGNCFGSNGGGAGNVNEIAGSYGVGTFTSGAVFGSHPGICFIKSYGSGAFAQGYLLSNSATSLATMKIFAYGFGSFAQGVVKLTGTPESGDTQIYAFGNGSFAQGYAHANGGGGAESYIYSGGKGSFAQGYTLRSAGGDSIIRAYGNGSFAQGKTRSRADGEALIEAYGQGSFAQGYVLRGTTGAADAIIRATAEGTFAQGYVFESGDGGDSYIEATAKGAFARGAVYAATNARARIQATANGAFAQGYAHSIGGSQHASILSTGLGNFAVGYAAPNTAVAASGTSNCGQFFIGENGLADSLQVGNAGIRFKGTSGAPPSPQDGDMWVTSSGNVVIRSNGLNQYQ